MEVCPPSAEPRDAYHELADAHPRVPAGRAEVAMLQARLTEVLRCRGGDTGQVERLLASAGVTATNLGMARLSGRIDALAHWAEGATRPDAVPRHTDRWVTKAGCGWT